MTDFKDSVPLDERDYTQNPVLPPAQGDRCCHQIIRECKLVIEQAEEKPQECFHKRSTPKGGSMDKQSTSKYGQSRVFLQENCGQKRRV